MGMFSNLVEAVLNELKYNDWKKNQSSIKKLFPNFPARVQAVANAGGLGDKLAVQDPETWMFTVASATGKGEYAVWFHFKNIPEMLEKWVPVKTLWNKAGTYVDHNKLAQEVLYEVDMDSDCDCAADTYWGSEWVKTQMDAQYGDEQNIPPVVRNPHGYGIMCKHAHLVWQKLPIWLSNFSNHLKVYWKDEIADIVKRVLDSEKPTEAPEVNEPEEQTEPVSDEEQISDNEEEVI
jgi:hypothetical protein